MAATGKFVMMRVAVLLFWCVWMSNSLAQTGSGTTNGLLPPCPSDSDSAPQSKILNYQVRLLPGQKIIDSLVLEARETHLAPEGVNTRPMLERIQQSKLADKYSTRIAMLASFSLQSRVKILDAHLKDDPHDWSLPLTEVKLMQLTQRFKEGLPYHPKLEAIGSILRIKHQSPYSTGAGAHFPLRGTQIPRNVPIYRDKNKSCWTTDGTKGERIFNYDGFEELAMLHDARGKRICSAVLISPNMALTADHCSELAGSTIAIPKIPGCFERNSSTSSSVACASETHKITTYKHFNEPPAAQKVTIKKVTIKIKEDEKIVNDPDIKLVRWTSPSNLSRTFPRLVAMQAKALNPPYEFVRAGFGYTENGTATHLSIGFHFSHKKPQFSERPVNSNDPFGLMVLDLVGTSGSRICEYDSGGGVYMGNPNGHEKQRDLVGIISLGHQIDANCLNSSYEGHALITPAIKVWICNQPEMDKSASCRP